MGVTLALLGSSLFVLPTGSFPSVVPVRIYRDDFGVAHIYAQDESALWYANGYVQAQDRLWELDLLRHLGYGEGASVVGPSVLSIDLSTRRDLYSRAELQGTLDGASPAFRSILDAYAAGVNRAAAEMAASGNLPAEFSALQHAFEPWTTLDSVAVASFLLARFGTGGGEELENARLLRQLEASIGDPTKAWKAFADVVWTDPDPSTTYATISTGRYAYAQQLPAPKGSPGALLVVQRAALEAAKISEPFGLATTPPSLGLLASTSQVTLPTPKWGSNALVVAPFLSEDGKALVGGGPQTGYFNPQILYEVGLHAGEVDVVGVGVAGAPGVVLGRTGSFAWTVTSGISDQTDVLALRATGSTSFAWDDGTRQLQCRKETHRVFGPPAATGGPPAVEVLQQEVCLAPVGTPSVLAPVIAVTKDADGDPAWYFAARTTSRYRELESAEKWLSIDRQSTLEGFRASLEGFAFTFNFHFAGKTEAGLEAGCFHHVGLQPLRNHRLDPRLPTPAGSAFDWSGYLTGAQLPHDCNPKPGYYANWNNFPQRGWSAGDGRELWGSVHRVERLDKELHDLIDARADANGNGRLALEDVKTILKNAATQDSLAGQIVPRILASTPAGAAPGATAALSEWAADDYPWRSNGAVSNPEGELYDDRGHAVYDALLPALLARVVGDEEGAFTRAVHFNPQESGDPHAGDHGQHNNMFSVLVDALGGATAHDWCDDVTTTVGESCNDAVAAAFDDAGLSGYATASEVPQIPQHFSKFTSLGAAPAYEIPMTNRATYYHFHVGSATGHSGSAIAPGQSGHLSATDLLFLLGGQPAPVHMRDQLPLYVNFEFKPVPVTEAEADAASTAPPIQLLVPST